MNAVQIVCYAFDNYTAVLPVIETEFCEPTLDHIVQELLFCLGLICCLNVINVIPSEIFSLIQHTQCYVF